ncbi:AraC family transcriptional regulator [Rhodoferax sp.]|uniref:AraC family transcriptional regulator n=1 Tax=Rhodoferax sp. TaxID=50421 RepID=UPI002725A4D8|nr:AraC family transcriptional regulator [Rhodoferax sp.]MDO9197025.1 AraC family transcriptional regulator [Rhodoferax sp.]
MRVWDFMRSPASVRLLVDFGLDLGLPPGELLKGSDVAQSQLEDPNAELSAAQELRVIGNLLRLSGKPGRLGLEVGLRYNLSVYGLWGYGLISSATLGDAMSHALRFIPLTFAFTSISYHIEDQLAVLDFDEPDLDDEARRFVVDRDMAAATVLFRELAGAEFSIQRVSLREPAEARRENSDGLVRAFGIEPTYGARSNSLAFDVKLLNRPLPQANTITATMCEQMCRDLLERRRARQGSAAIVRQYLGIRGDRPTDLASMASLMNTSGRTLKRRLKEEGTSFRALLMQSQSSSAAELLQDGTLSVTEIASRLGFSDASSFSQTFKRWFGVAPNNYRKAQAEGVPAGADAIEG